MHQKLVCVHLGRLRSGRQRLEGDASETGVCSFGCGTVVNANSGRDSVSFK